MQTNNSFQVTALDNNKLTVQNPAMGLEVKLSTTLKDRAHIVDFGYISVDSVEVDMSKRTNTSYNQAVLNQAVLVVSRKTCNYVQIVDENGNILGAIDLGFGKALSVYPYAHCPEFEPRELFCRDCKEVVRDSTFIRQSESSMYGTITEILCKTCHERQ